MRYAIRTLRRSPGFTIIALLTLALGIGANTAIFSFVNGVLLKPLPYRDPHGIVMVWEKPPGGDRNGISTLNFLDWKNQNTVFEHMAAINFGGNVTLTGAGQPEELQGVRVSASYFDIFGVQAVFGRTFAPDEDQLGKSQVVILSHRLWENRFGADPSIVGRTLTLSGKPCTVVGVMPAHSPFDRSYAQLWIPLSFEPRDMTRDYHWMLSFARLKPGVSLEKAQAGMDAIGARIAAAYPESNKGWGVTVERFEDRIVGPQLRRSLFVLLAAVGAILLIGCANLANLTLARGAAREREIAVRASLGAGAWRLIRQLLTENLLVAAAGGALGLALGYAMIRGLILLAPPFSLPSEADVSIDPAILLFTLAVSLLTALLFGLAPAIHAARVDPASAMKEGGRSASSGAGRARLRSALIVAEVALAFVLAGAGLLVGSFFRMLHVDTGFTSTNVTTARLPIARDRFAHPEQLLQYVRLLDDRLRAAPGVRDVAFSNVLPMQGWGDGMPFLVAGHAFVDRANRRACFYKRVTGSYFRTLEIRLLRGRTFTDRDTRGGAPVIVINEEMARRYFKGEDPLGKRILIQEILYGQPGLGPEIPWEVVGIVGDEQTGSLIDTKSPGVYVTFDQSPTNDLNMVLRASLDPRMLTSAIHAAVHAVDKDQAIADLETLEQIKSGTVSSDRMQTMLLAIFAALALLLAAIGIYGVISYSVTQRTHELGIRAALGASRGSLLGMVILRGMQLTLIGLAIGAAGALALTRLLASLLFGISPRDPVTLIGVAAVLSAVALLACYIPARRAAAVDPLVALRYE